MHFLLRKLREKLGDRHGFVHSVGLLVGGTTVAQAVGVLALPILTRLYTPSDFSVLAVYASLLAILSVSACLRFEIAIPLPANDEDAAALLVLGLSSASCIAILTAIFVALFPSWVVDQLGAPQIRPYLWMIPLGIWVTGSYAAIQYWSTRKRKFRRVAQTRMAQALGSSAAQIGVGVAGAAPFGLLVGQMISGGLGMFGLARDAWREDRMTLRSVNIAALRRAFHEYSRFPKYSALEALLNNAGIQVPVIIIAALAIGPEAGYLMLARKVMAAPMGMVGAAVGQVFLSRAPEKMREGDLGRFTEQVLAGLFRTGVGPLLFAGIVAAPIFVVAFGDEWRRAGELVGWMTPWFVLQFLSSPVSMVMHVTGRQRAMLMLTGTGLALRLGSMGLAYEFAATYFSEIYALSGAVFYLLCCVIFYRAADVGREGATAALLKGLAPIVAWIAAGISLRAAVDIFI